MTIINDYARARCRDVIASLAADAANEAAERLDDQFMLGWNHHVETVLDRDVVNQLGKAMPEPDEIASAISLLVDVAKHRDKLSYEDRQYVAIARGWLVDALLACFDGNFDTAANHAHQCFEQLHWMTYTRRRSGKYDHRYPFVEMRPTFIRYTERANEFVKTMNRAKEAKLG